MFSWVTDLFTFLGNFFTSLPSLIADGVSFFFTSFYTMLFESVAPLLDNAFMSMGFDVGEGWSVEFWNALNYFFPVNESLACLMIVFLFWIEVLLIKIALKLVPAVY